MISEIVALARPAIRKMAAYKSARSLGLKGEIYLDANESPWDPTTGRGSAKGGLNRYPAPQPEALVRILSELYAVDPSCLTVGRGTDDAIDWIVRTFCEAEKEEVGICPPTYGMYEVAANLQGAGIRYFPTKKEDGFAIDAKAILSAWTPSLKVVFVCSPNNPTGNAVPHETLAELAEGLLGKAILVVDEAYGEFSDVPSFTTRLKDFPNAIVLRTLSKAWGLAGARCGTAIAHPEITKLLQKVRAPYPIPQPALEAVLSALQNSDSFQFRLQEWKASRDVLAAELAKLPEVTKVFPTDGNFLLLDTADASALLSKCLEAGIVVRDRSSDTGLMNCVRISVGTAEENVRLLRALRGDKTSVEAKSPTAAPRFAEVKRVTKETSVSVQVDLDRSGQVAIKTGIAYFDHMLDQLAKHGGFNLVVDVKGDVEVDEHHTVEDTAIGIGEALRKALGDKAGIGRYGFSLPMDEAQAQVLIDLSGRAYFKFDGQFTREYVGELPTELVPHFFRSLSDSLLATLHMEVKGENNHHMVESLFKALGRALRPAIGRGPTNELPSTKGIL